MQDPFQLRDFSAYERNNPFMAYNHIEICSASASSSLVKVELAQESKNLHGAVHGGLLYAMADCVAGVTARASGEDYVTQSAHINFLRNVKEGTVYAQADTIKRGRRVIVLHITVFDGNHVLLADGAIDMLRRSGPCSAENGISPETHDM